MKRLKLIMGLTAAVCCLASTSQAVLVTSGTGILPSALFPAAATTLTVDYEVDLTGLIYTYSYTLNNPLTDTTSPNAFSVTFDANGSSVIATSAGGTVNTGSSVSWTFAPVAPGLSSGVLWFTSLLKPTLGPAGALDSVPPSPWSTLGAGGAPVAVPVPEPTTVIAGALLLLPFAASTLRVLRRNRTSV